MTGHNWFCREGNKIEKKTDQPSLSLHKTLPRHRTRPGKVQKKFGHCLCMGYPACVFNTGFTAEINLSYSYNKQLSGLQRFFPECFYEQGVLRGFFGFGPATVKFEI